MSNDTLDDLLQRAFRAELANAQDGDLTQRVLAKLRRRSRRRNLTLAGAGLLALTLAALSAQPAASALVEWLASSEPVAAGELAAAMQNLGIGLPMLLTVALAPWLLALLDDQV